MPIRPENKNRYPKDWAAISRRIRYERAGGRCECRGECGRGHHGRCPNEEGGVDYSSGKKVVLTTAHLNHTPEDCSDENLRCMCAACHLHYDKDHHAQTRLLTRLAVEREAGQLPMFAMMDLQELE